MGKSDDNGGISQKSECGGLGPGDIDVNGIGTVAAANVVPENRPPDESNIAGRVLYRSVQVRAVDDAPTNHGQPVVRWGVGRVGAPDHCRPVGLHRSCGPVEAPHSGHRRPEHELRANAGSVSLVDRGRTVWARMEALGLEIIGPQFPNGWAANSPQPDVPNDTNSGPTYRTMRQSTVEANRQLNYAFASRGFHNNVRPRALNGVDE